MFKEYRSSRAYYLGIFERAQREGNFDPAVEGETPKSAARFMARHEMYRRWRNKYLPEKREAARAYHLAEFIGTAIASGVIGNVAYDLLKAGVAKRLRRAPRETPVEEDELVLIARFAMRTTSKSEGLPVPRLSKIDSAYRLMAQWQSEAGRGFGFDYEDVVSAKVVIPPGNLSGQQIAVTLYKVVGSSPSQR